MSRRKTQAEIDAEIEAEEARNAERYRLQAECPHWNCKPSAWNWCGIPREMTCDDCGATNDIGDA